MSEEIKSRWFRLSPARFARVTFIHSIKRRWYLYVVLALAFTAALTELVKISSPQISPLFGLLIALLGYPVILTWGYVKYLGRIKRPSNRQFFMDQRVGISGKSFMKEAQDGSRSTVGLETIVKVERMEEFTLIYVSDQQAFFLPDGVWQKPEDENQFKDWLKAIPCRQS